MISTDYRKQSANPVHFQTNAAEGFTQRGLKGTQMDVIDLQVWVMFQSASRTPTAIGGGPGGIEAGILHH